MKTIIKSRIHPNHLAQGVQRGIITKVLLRFLDCFQNSVRAQNSVKLDSVLSPNFFDKW